MGRKKTQLNITRHPGVGQAYVVQRHPDGAMVRVATLCTRDIKADPSLGKIRQFSGDNPYFKTRITRADGGGKCDPVLLTFDCRSDQPCVASDGTYTYQWLDLDHKVAVGDGHLIVNDTPEKAAPKRKKVDAPSVETEEEIENMVEPLNEETEFMSIEDLVADAPTEEVAPADEVAPATEEEIPFTLPTEVKARKPRMTFYRMVDGQIQSRRGVEMREGEFTSREEAMATL